MINVEKLKQRLEALAKLKAVSEREDWQADDSGNFDDTFSDGIQDGEIFLARQLLNEFFGS